MLLLPLDRFNKFYKFNKFDKFNNSGSNMLSPDDLTANGLASLKTDYRLPEDGKPPRRL